MAAFFLPSKKGPGQFGGPGCREWWWRACAVPLILSCYSGSELVGVSAMSRWMENSGRVGRQEKWKLVPRHGVLAGNSFASLPLWFWFFLIKGFKNKGWKLVCAGAGSGGLLLWLYLPIEGRSYPHAAQQHPLYRYVQPLRLSSCCGCRQT